MSLQKNGQKERKKPSSNHIQLFIFSNMVVCIVEDVELGVKKCIRIGMMKRMRVEKRNQNESTTPRAIKINAADTI